MGVSSGTFNLEGGSITGNRANPGSGIAANGGGVWVASGSTFNMSGGEITDNHAPNFGGGVYLSVVTSSFNMTGGRITGNHTTKQVGSYGASGAGVFIMKGKMSLSGSPVITGNYREGTDGPGTAYNVESAYNNPLTINIAGPLSGEAQVGITAKANTAFTSGLPGNGTEDAFESDDDRYAPRLTDAGEACLRTLYTVSFSAGEGGADTETMDDIRATAGESITIPACSFTPAKGMVFDRWQIGSDPENTIKAKEPYTVSGDVTLTALWKKGEPAFKGHSLVLNGQIGVNFYLELPYGMTGEDYPGAYVTLTAPESNRINRFMQYSIPEHTYVDNGADTGRYEFTAYASSIQLADKYTPVFHYFTEDGEEQTVEGEPYAACDYIRWALGAGSSLLDGQQLQIIRTLADYGHYAQIYLSEYNKWTIGEDYAEMSTYVTEAFDAAAAAQDAAAYKYSRTQDSSQVKSVTYRLIFGSTLQLDVFITPAAGTTLTTVTVDGAEVPVKMSGSRAVVSISDIYASDLTDMYTIVAGDCTIHVSAMSYVEALAGKEATGEKLNNMLCALYAYAKACR